MNKNKILSVTLIIFILCFPVYAKEKKVYSYQKGILLDLIEKQTSQTTYLGAGQVLPGGIVASQLIPSTSTKNHQFLIIQVGNFAYLVEHQYTIKPLDPSKCVINDPIYIRISTPWMYIKNNPGFKEVTCKILKVVRV